MWVLGIVVLLVLMIPLTAIVLDSEVGRALARRVAGGAPGDEADEKRVKALEEEVQYLTQSVQSLQEETRFIRQLLEKPEEMEALPPGEE